MHTGHGAGYASYILEPCTHPHVLRVDAADVECADRGSLEALTPLL
jgi:hypothetical protein